MGTMVQDVLIAGAGIGGLTLAVALQRRGVRVRVLERSPRLGAAGAGIALAPNGIKGLSRIGLADEALRAGATIARSGFRDDQGRPIGPDLEMEPLWSALGAPGVALHRARLHALLAGALGPEVIRLDSPVTAFENEAGSVHVSTAGGVTFTGEILVGADGLHSVVRARIAGNGVPRYAGYTSWRGVTLPHAAEPPPGVTESWGRGARFGIVPIGFGEIYWFATANAPAGGHDADVLDELRRRFAGWHLPIARLLEATPPDRIVRTDIADREPVTTWHQGRAVLLGDAAHPMTPNIGQGACQAIEDAVVLDQCLAAHETHGAAFAEYERRRVARANGMVLAARRMGQVAQWSHPVAAWLRNRLVGAMPASAAVKQMKTMLATDF